jgi:hypothetical protein
VNQCYCVGGLLINQFSWGLQLLMNLPVLLGRGIIGESTCQGRRILSKAVLLTMR